MHLSLLDHKVDLLSQLVPHGEQLAPHLQELGAVQLQLLAVLVDRLQACLAGSRHGLEALNRLHDLELVQVILPGLLLQSCEPSLHRVIGGDDRGSSTAQALQCGRRGHAHRRPRLPRRREWPLRQRRTAQAPRLH